MNNYQEIPKRADAVEWATNQSADATPLQLAVMHAIRDCVRTSTSSRVHYSCTVYTGNYMVEECVTVATELRNKGYIAWFDKELDLCFEWSV